MRRNRSVVYGKRPAPAGRAVLLACAALLGASSAFAQAGLPRREAYPSNRFDTSDELKITGEVLQVDTMEAETIIWMRPTAVVKKGFGERPGYNESNGVGMIWRVEGSGVAKIKDNAKLGPGAEIVVTGVNSVDKTCKPTCRIKSDKVTVR